MGGMKNAERKPGDRQQEELPSFIRDRFSKTRGGPSELLSLGCTQCGTQVFLYQKDGHGALIRCYVDRVYLPDDLHHPLDPAVYQQKKNMPNLACPSCHTLVGIPMVFKPENRLAYRLIKGRLTKKKLK